MIAHCVSVINCKVTFGTNLLGSRHPKIFPPRSIISLSAAVTLRLPVPVLIIVIHAQRSFVSTLGRVQIRLLVPVANSTDLPRDRKSVV